jgi:hypothetical protein
MRFGRGRLKRMAMSWAIPTSYVCLSNCICGKMHSKVVGINLFSHELLIIVNIPLWIDTLTIKEHKITRALGTICTRCNLIYYSIGYMAREPSQMQPDALVLRCPFLVRGVSSWNILTMTDNLWVNKIITPKLLVTMR